MPFQAYAYVGTQQQKRKDDLLEKFEGLGTTIKNMPEDQEFSADAYNDINQEINTAVDDFISGNTSHDQTYKAYLGTTKKISEFESPHGKQAAALDRYKRDQANKVNAHTSAGGNQAKDSYYQSVIRADAEDNPINYTGTDWTRQTEFTFQPHMQDSDMDKLLNGKLQHFHDDLRKQPGWDIKQSEVFDQMLAEQDIPGAIAFIEQHHPAYGKSKGTLKKALIDDLSVDTDLSASLRDEMAAEKYHELIRNAHENGEQVDQSFMNEAARTAKAYGDSPEVERLVKDKIAAKADSKATISSSYKGGDVSVKPVPVIPKTASRKRSAVEKQIQADLKLTYEPQALIPTDDWDYGTTRDRLNMLNEKINDYDIRLAAGEVLEKGEIEDYQTSVRSKLGEEYYLEGLTGDYVNSDAFLTKAAEIYDQVYVDTYGYELIGTNAYPNAKALLNDPNKRKAIQSWANATMFEGDPTFSNDLGTAIDDLFGGQWLGDSWNAEENKDKRKSYGNDLRGFVNDHVHETGLTGDAEMPIAFSSQYYDETSDKNVTGVFSEHANDILEWLDGTEGHGEGWDVIGGNKKIGVEGGGVLNYTQTLEGLNNGLPLKVGKVKALKQTTGVPFQALATWVVDEEAWKTLPDDVKEKLEEKRANFKPHSMKITPLDNSNIGRRLEADQLKVYREAQLSDTFGTELVDEADLQVANFKYGDNFAPAARVELYDTWKYDDANKKVSQPQIFDIVEDDNSATGTTQLYIRKKNVIKNWKKGALTQNTNINQAKISEFEIVRPVLDEEGYATNKYEKVFPYDGDKTRTHSLKDLMLYYYRNHPKNVEHLEKMSMDAQVWAANRANIKIEND
jgi:hypothetical protein